MVVINSPHAQYWNTSVTIVWKESEYSAFLEQMTDLRLTAKLVSKTAPPKHSLNTWGTIQEAAFESTSQSPSFNNV